MSASKKKPTTPEMAAAGERLRNLLAPLISKKYGSVENFAAEYTGIDQKDTLTKSAVSQWWKSGQVSYAKRRFCVEKLGVSLDEIDRALDVRRPEDPAGIAAAHKHFDAARARGELPRYDTNGQPVYAKNLSPEAAELVRLISEADTSQSVTSDSWKHLAGVVREMMRGGKGKPVNVALPD